MLPAAGDQRRPTPRPHHARVRGPGCRAPQSPFLSLALEPASQDRDQSPSPSLGSRSVAPRVQAPGPCRPQDARPLHPHAPSGLLGETAHYYLPQQRVGEGTGGWRVYDAAGGTGHLRGAFSINTINSVRNRPPGNQKLRAQLPEGGLPQTLMGTN